MVEANETRGEGIYQKADLSKAGSLLCGVSLDFSWFMFYLGMISVSAFKIKPNI